jgi:hypothetical protein
VQLQKAILQMPLDNGNWDNACLLWPGADPLGQREFGGSEAEMRSVHMHRKAILELRNKGGKLPGAQDDASDDGKAGRQQPGRKAGRGRGKGASAPALETQQ